MPKLPIAEETVNKIVQLLKDDEIKIKDIITETGVSSTSVYRINKKYNIRGYEFNKDQIKDFLKHTNLSYLDISKRVGCSYEYVYKISRQFGLRQTIRSADVKKEKIKELLKMNNEIKFIAAMTNVSVDLVNEIKLELIVMDEI